MKRSRFVWVLMVSVIITLFGCGSGGGGGSNSAGGDNNSAEGNITSHPYYPAVVGYSWTYDVTPSTGTPYTSVVTIISSNNSGFSTKSQNSNTTTYGYGQTDYIYDGTTLKYTNSFSYNADESLAGKSEYTPAALVLPSSMADNTTESTVSTVKTTSGTTVKTSSVTRSITVNGEESVTTSAGTFTATKMTLTSSTTSSSGTITYTTSQTITYWYVKDIGRVKFVSTVTSGGTTTTTTTELKSYSLGSISNSPKIISLAGANSHSVALKNDGTVWTWGENDLGQLGDGTRDSRYTHIQVSVITDTAIAAIAAGGSHTSVLKKDGTVWSWGYNYYGQLGSGTKSNWSLTAVQANGLTDVIAIASGQYVHMAALKSDGTVWTWGRNSNGQLGDGTTTDRYSPVQVNGLTDVIAIAAGRDHTSAVKNDGTVWTWGLNFSGQLGDGTTTDRYSPVQVSGLSGVAAITCGAGFTLALKNDGTVWGWGYDGGDGTTNKTTPYQVSGLTNIISIAAKWNHAIALKSDGTVWTAGYNSSGQLGDGTTVDRTTFAQVDGLTGITAIATGAEHSLALKNDGTVWAWGLNGAGQLGDGTIINKTTPTLVTGL